MISLCFFWTGGCLGDVTDCEILGTCANDHTQLSSCSPGESEEGACGDCGVTTRTCTNDGTWPAWNECVDPAPGCNPCQEPTWDTDIDDLMSRRCTRCHWECRDYDSLMPWVDDGQLRWWTDRNHYISGNDKETLLRWIEIGAPEADCDVQ